MKVTELEAFRPIMDNLYNAYRVVDPVRKEVFIQKEGVAADIPCYDLWQQKKVCENCISIRTINENRTYCKAEFDGERVYMITSIPIENEQGPMVLEVLNDITDSGIIETLNGKSREEITAIVNSRNAAQVIDELTGIYNRRYINDRLAYDIVQSSERHTPLSVIMLDVDHFKIVNDTYGYVAGDHLLRSLAAVIRERVRKDLDWCARYGGEEFMVCLPGATQEIARQVAEKLRRQVEETVFCYNEHTIRITCSLGISPWMPEFNSWQDMVEKADHNLDRAKREGRNRVCGD